MVDKRSDIGRLKAFQMKNCPMFSLRSNSIESRFRSIRGAILLLISLWL